jgi:hypothetical protein
MPLIDLADDPELYSEIHAHAKLKDGSEIHHRDDFEWRCTVAVWKEAKERLALALKFEKEMREDLIKAAKSKNCIGFGVKVQRIMRKGPVRYDQIEALQGVDLEQYRDMPSESWRITVDE